VAQHIININIKAFKKMAGWQRPKITKKRMYVHFSATFPMISTDFMRPAQRDVNVAHFRVASVWGNGLMSSPENGHGYG